MHQSRVGGLASLQGSSFPVCAGCQHYTLARQLANAKLDYSQMFDWASVKVVRDPFGSRWDGVLGSNVSIDRLPK